MRGVTAGLVVGLVFGSSAAAMTLSSSDIRQGEPMPAAQIYPRCGGKNVSPELSWTGAPAAARSIVLTMIDLDVKPAQWSHWVVVGLPTNVRTLPRGAAVLPRGAAAVVSNFGDAAYAGPCPPAGTGTHHYQLTVWAIAMTRFPAVADEPADKLAARLRAAALDRASLTATVDAKP